MPKLLVIIAAGLLLAGCGSKKNAPAKVTEDERALSNERKVNGKKRTRKFQEKRQVEQLDRLCADIDCSDEIRTELRTLIESSYVTRPRRGELRDRGSHREARSALADAFASDTFAAPQLEAFHTAVRPDGEVVAKRDETMLPGLITFHGKLEPKQREAVALLTEARGLSWLTSARPPARKGQLGTGPAGAQRRAKRTAKRLCEAMTCVPEQETTVAAVLGKLDMRRAEAPAVARTALAAAVRTDVLSQDAVTAFFAASVKQTLARASRNDAVWLALHAMLDSEQREALSENIAERGLQALGGGGRVRHAGPLGRGR
ncbi:MAG: hypothetical protein JKY37_29705 [Nannocystaceae bacterium]|nr:hypothetical protein [Nannocystaceae bacterium]